MAKSTLDAFSEGSKVQLRDTSRDTEYYDLTPGKSYTIMRHPDSRRAGMWLQDDAGEIQGGCGFAFELVDDKAALAPEGEALFNAAVEARAAFETAEYVWKQARDAYNRYDHDRLTAAVSALHEAGK